MFYSYTVLFLVVVLSSGMAPKAICVFALIVLLGASSFASPLSPAGSDTKEEPAIRTRRDVLAKVLTRRESPGLQSRDARMERMERMVTLPDDQREFMNRQIMQALAGVCH